MFNGFESLFSIPVIAVAAWWYIQRQLKRAIEKLENSVDKKDFEKFVAEFHKAKDDLWKERDSLKSDVDQIIGFLKSKGYEV